jgi:hypothetical protein
MEHEAQAVIADGAAATATTEVISQPASAAPTVEELKSALEAERALREIAESDAINAKKDIVAIKTGKKRGEIDAAQAAQVVVTPKQDGQQPVTTQPNAEILAEIAELKRQNAEILRGTSARTMGGMPTGGGGQAESPAPKPQGYFSDAKRAILRGRGYSDEKIARIESLIQRGTLASYGERSASDVGVAKRQY